VIGVRGFGIREMLMVMSHALQEKLGDVFDIGWKAAAKNKWVSIDKGNKDLVLRKV
jgi:hypothetical protein